MSNLKLDLSFLSDCIPQELINKSFGSIRTLVGLLGTELQTINIDHLYEEYDLVNEIRKYPLDVLFNDMIVFSAKMDTELVVFYGREIRRKAHNNKIAMMFVSQLERAYHLALADFIDNKIRDQKIKAFERKPVSELTQRETDFISRCLKLNPDSDQKLGENLISFAGDNFKYDRDQHGYVYILQDVSGGEVKIGQTKDVNKRLNTLTNTSGRNLKLIFKSESIVGYKQVEASLMAHFSDFRRRGEWFSAPPLDVIGEARKQASCRIVVDENLVSASNVVDKYNAECRSLFLRKQMRAM